MPAVARRGGVSRPRAPRRTVRLRLTLLYGSLFLASGAALLAIAYGLVYGRLTSDLVTQGPAADARGPVTAPSPVADSLRAQQAADLLTQTMLQVALADPALTLGSLRNTCQEVLATSKEQDRLIRALLTLARGQRGLDQREPLDLAEITRQALRARQREATASGLRVDTTLSPAPAVGDPPLAQILVSNLIENAIRHNIPGGHIQVTTGTRAGRATLTVANTGPHVPVGQAGRLLEPFQRLDGKRGHDHEGLGLGLSIVAAIADAHDATLSVRPRPSGGLSVEAAFRLTTNEGARLPGSAPLPPRA